MSDTEEQPVAAPEPEEPKAEPKEKPKAKEKAKGKDKEKGKAKGKEKSKGKDKQAADGPSIAAHPHAAHAVRSMKAWGGLIGFGLAAYMSAHAGVTLGVLGFRALLGGVAGYMVAWFCGVVAWRAIVAAEVRAHMESQAEQLRR
ncbi:MAG: hypothetical protein ABSC56_00925 [Solirubrobacteraceae bacterium]|jgi:hypothetical protein